MVAASVLHGKESSNATDATKENLLCLKLELVLLVALQEQSNLLCYPYTIQ